MTMDGDFRSYLGEPYPNLEKNGKVITLRLLAVHRAGIPKNVPDTDALFKNLNVDTLPYQLIDLEKSYDDAAYLKALRELELRSELVYSNFGIKLIGFGPHWMERSSCVAGCGGDLLAAHELSKVRGLQFGVDHRAAKWRAVGTDWRPFLSTAGLTRWPCGTIRRQRRALCAAPRLFQRHSCARLRDEHQCAVLVRGLRQRLLSGHWRRRLVKVRVPYGAPEMVMQLPGPTRGGSSNGNGTILVAGRRLYLLAAPGGRTETLDVPGLTKGAILYPEFLPAGDAALFLWLPGDGTGNEIYLASFKAGKLVDPVPLLKNDTAGVRAEEFASTITKENACYPFIHSIGTRERRLERQTRKVTDSNEPRAQELGHRRTERSRASDHSARRVVLPRFSS
jgi:hypothetical protein